MHQIPEFKWKDAGTAIVNVIPLGKDDSVVSIIPIKDIEQSPLSVFFFTKRGQVKRSELKDYATTRSTAIAACKLADGDEVISVTTSDGMAEIVLISQLGMSIRFAEKEVNTMGRVFSRCSRHAAEGRR